MFKNKAYLLLLIASCFIGVFLSLQLADRLANSKYQDSQIVFAAQWSKNYNEVVQRVNRTFDLTYNILHAMAMIPGVRNIERHAANFQEDTRETVAQLYNSLASQVNISEVYIVPIDIDPDQIDPLTNKPQTPIVMFDQFMGSRRSDQLVDNSKEKQSDVEAIESFEYRQMKEQAAYFVRHFPKIDSFAKQDYPANISHEVVTCDNAEFSRKDLDANENDSRKGIVYSVPFYDLSGSIKGMVSAVIRSRVIARMFDMPFYKLENASNKQGFYHITTPNINKELLEKVLNAPRTAEVCFSKVNRIGIRDIFQWQLIMAIPAQYKACADMVHQREVLRFYFACTFLLLSALIIGMIFLVLLFRENARLERARREAESTSRAKSDFVANMSHEIRTPMNAILGFSDMLAVSDLTEKQRSYVSTIVSSGQLLLSIINDILDFSKFESGKVKIDLIDFDLEHLTYDIYKIGQVRFKDKDINAYIDWDQTLPQWVKGDPTRLRQVILNLIGNAAKFTSHGDIGFIIKLIRKDVDGTVIIRFTVKDSGIGIAANVQKQLFNAFFQVDESTTRKYGGIGLGLVVCKRIVEAMGGTIGFRSELGVGSEFFFEVPFKTGSSIVEQPIQPLPKERLKGKVVVIVDDHRPSLEIIGRYCQEMGLSVAAALASPKDAMIEINKMYETGIVPDIIICDVMVSGMDGYEFAHRIRLVNAFKSIRIIAVTSDARVGAAREAQDSGFDAFLAKPVYRLDLLNIILTVLGDKRPSTAPIVTKHVAAEVELKGLRILVVDDSISNQQLMKAYLDMFGCTYAFANNGEEAVEKIQNDSYDLCLMDLQMPIMSGEEAAKRIRALGFKNLPIVALTASALAQDQKRCLDAGMNDYMTKPIQVKFLKEKINQWARRN